MQLAGDPRRDACRRSRPSESAARGCLLDLQLVEDAARRGGAGSRRSAIPRRASRRRSTPRRTGQHAEEDRRGQVHRLDRQPMRDQVARVDARDRAGERNRRTRPPPQSRTCRTPGSLARRCSRNRSRRRGQLGPVEQAAADLDEGHGCDAHEGRLRREGTDRDSGRDRGIDRRSARRRAGRRRRHSRRPRRPVPRLRSG